MQLSLMDAAQRQLLAYTNPHKLNYKMKFRISNVLAYLQRDGVLAIVGTNDAADWFNNIFFFAVEGSHYGRLDSQVASGKWHSGFLWHATKLIPHLPRGSVKFVIGHSLGEAAAQILSTHYEVPGITFGAPKAAYGQVQHSQHLNVIYERDPVPDWPDRGGHYAWVGKTMEIAADTVENWPYHKVKHYLPRIERAISQGDLPRRWPILSR